MKTVSLFLSFLKKIHCITKSSQIKMAGNREEVLTVKNTEAVKLYLWFYIANIISNPSPFSVLSSLQTQSKDHYLLAHLQNG